jgi:hypothetical protein
MSLDLPSRDSTLPLPDDALLKNPYFDNVAPRS